MTTKATPIRVLIAEDSPVARELLVAILQSASGLQVVGAARDGAEAVRLARRLKPDVITMDAHMPELDGFAATRQIMAEIPRPIVIISASLNKNERDMTFYALEAGALSVLEKPTMDDPPEVHEALIAQVKLMAEVKVVRRWNRDEAILPRSMGDRSEGKLNSYRRSESAKIQVVAIASSTGGPGVLAKILSELPANFPAPILIVQHITPGFGAGLASWLNKQTPLEVRLARHTDEPQAGQVLIAPDECHMLVNHLGLIALSQTPPEYGLRPSANVLFQSVAQVYGATALGIILTGMGSDGAEGLSAMRAMGAPTIAQDKDSCVVFGMPAVAIDLGAAEQILPAHKIAAAMMMLVQAKG
ncbi:MAG: chemotaxis-specific protein-glutamate methyltransferase CheB [Chloroflexi bacterium]|nr:chemotaxis-specific protein-glutamate methyltransferase CheB [Chloroflexota bacterium]